MKERELTGDEFIAKLREDDRRSLDPSPDDHPVMAAVKRMVLAVRYPHELRRPVRGELTPQEALANLFGSDASPVDVRNPEELANLVVAFLQASGFRIIPEEDAEGDR
jgi:hypothetical protein